MLLTVLVKVLLLSLDWTAGQRSLSLNDLAFAMPTSTSRHSLVMATRAGREGVRTVIATNDTRAALKDLVSSGSMAGHSSETILEYPDEIYNSTLQGPHAPRPGDVRSALTPFMAHAHFLRTSHQYKWMLYGDDDTLFFMPNVLRLLERLDHRVPLAITENLWCARWSGMEWTGRKMRGLQDP